MLTNPFLHILLTILTVLPCSLPAAEVTVRLDSDSKNYQITGPGIESLRAGFSATVEISGKRQVLASANGVASLNPAGATEQTPYGPAVIQIATVRFPDHKLTMDIRLGQVPGQPCVLIQPSLHNEGSQPVRLLELNGMTMDQEKHLTLTGSQNNWLITSMDRSTEGRPPNFLANLESLQGTMEIREYGTLYRPDGVGFLFGPVGEPVAYLTHRISRQPGGAAELRITSEMSGIQVDPGESRVGQQAVFWMQEPRAALAKWAVWVAQTHHARTGKGALAGWCSWYHLTSKIKGSDVLGVVEEVRKQPARLRPQVIQIDDGYQDFDGVWDANAKFSEGMPHYAKRIAETGARAGLWMAPTLIGKNAPWLRDPENMEAVWGKKFKLESRFRPDESGWLDPTHPRAIAHITERVRHAVENGFTYLKIDFNLMGDGGWHERKQTSFQILREHFTRIRKAAGEDTYILACIVEPNRAVVGLADAHRSSHDAHRGGVRSAINDVLRCYQLNSRWFAIDNDIYYLAPDVPSVGNVQGGWDLHRTWLSLMGISSGAALTSDPWHWQEMRPHQRTVEIMQPPAKERAEVLDLGMGAEWPRVASLVNRPWGKQVVAVLWNPSESEKAITMTFAGAGLDPDKPHAVWSFWDNRFLGIATDSWTTPKLAPNACQHLVCTQLDTAGDKPVLIGSNLHIHSGAAEIQQVESASNSISITLNDAGARDGDLFVFSRSPLKVTRAQGCKVAGIVAAGVDVWKVGVCDRQHGIPQTITMAAAELPETCYLFSYFLKNGEDGLHLAWSTDGLKWQALNGGKSFLKPEVGKSKLMRDPCVTTGPDGTFHMVWTDSWDSGTIGYASSKDLITWSPQKAIPVMAHEPATRNCWAPEIVYVPQGKHFRIFWASTIPGRFPETELGGRNDNNHRMYSTTTTDFTSFSPTVLYFDPGHNVIDSTITEFGGKTVMIYKDETKAPEPMKNLKLATAKSPAGPFSAVPGSINPPGSWVEGPTVLRVGKEAILYFDAYTRHRYEALATSDFKTWRDISKDLSMPAGIRHGTAFAVPAAILRELMKRQDP